MISSARLRALESTDQMSPALRECVHEFGLPIVNAFVKFGVKSPVAIREIVKEVWGGARQTSQRNNAYGTLDWLLLQSSAGLSAKALCRILADHSLVLTTVEPSRAMLNASLAEVSGFDTRCSKDEKHRRRLRAALRAASAAMLERGVRVVGQQEAAHHV